jgi:hypothetical protein
MEALLFSSLGDRKRNREPAALTDGARQSDFAPVQQDQFPSDRQSQTCPLLFVFFPIDLLEALEKRRRVIQG